ncbi:TonB-dependent receptor [Persephonella sp. KM09-Lau-8]|uniref:TonB-dependent receptor plug domain-containing protein n=1 Tax=Persephonella sp. KM09-Lau-8 TaxID=1158345 RepID=UPI0004965F7D|nr:TonB-dependent receptor [Persephonella sp. KM09-Lau-8]
MKKKVILAFCGVLLSGNVFASSESILSLMKKYEEASDLSKRTREESLGHLLVFTRKDLETMHIYTLSDLLKIIPLNNRIPNNYGVETLVFPGGGCNIPIIYRLYIDDHEVSSINTYSPFLTYDRYPLDHIDHVEIYYSSGAISVTTEPSKIIIKLYTKEPKRENATKFRISVSSKKSYAFNIFAAYQRNENLSYLVNFSKSYFRFPRPRINNQTVNRNQFRKDLFFKLNYYETQVELSLSDVKRGGFFGLSGDKAPDFAHTCSFDSYLVVSQKFDKNTKLVLSYDFQKRKYKELNKATDGGIIIPKLFNLHRPPIIEYYEKVNFHKFAAVLNKKIKTENNLLLLGTFWRYYNEDRITNYYKNVLNIKYDLTDAPRVKNYYIGSVYLENSYNINDKNLIILGANLDKFKFYGQKSKNRLNLRAGFISFVNSKLMFKGFASRYYVIPSMLMIELSEKTRLEPMMINAYTGEVSYKFGSNEIKGFAGYYRIDNIVKLDRRQFVMKNSGESENFHEYGITFKRNFNNNLYSEINYWFTDVGKGFFSPDRGGYFRLGGDFDRLKLYTDLIYKGDYKPYGIHVKESYDLRLSLSYNLPDDWNLTITGDNLLNRGEKKAYMDIFRNKGVISVYDRQIILTVEKLF